MKHIELSADDHTIETITEWCASNDVVGAWEPILRGGKVEGWQADFSDEVGFLVRLRFGFEKSRPIAETAPSESNVVAFKRP